jgi:hypothetical protein
VSGISSLAHASLVAMSPSIKFGAAAAADGIIPSRVWVSRPESRRRMDNAGSEGAVAAAGRRARGEGIDGQSGERLLEWDRDRHPLNEQTK